MVTIWDKTLNLGTSPSYIIYKNRRIRVLNTTCIVAGFAFLIIGLLAALNHRWTPFLIQIFRVVICLATILLVYKKKYASARLFFLFGIVISNLLFSSLVPYQTSNVLNYTLVYVFVFYFTPPGKIANIVFILISIVGSASYYYELNYLPNTNQGVHLISFLAISIVSYFILSHYQKENISYQRQLEIQNERLQQQNEIINAQSEEIKIQGESIGEQNKKLEKERDFLLEAQSLAQLGNWEYDMKTEQLQWSDTTYDILELDRSEFSPNSYNYMQSMTDVSQLNFEKLHNRLIKEGVPFETEVEYITSKNNSVFMLVRAKSERKNGKTTKILGTMLDITELKVYEKKLQLLNASKDRILATVAHDLRNPINQVQGLVSILEMQNMNPSDADIFTKMKQSCQKGLILIKELLEISTLEDTDFKLQKELLNLQDIVNNSIDDFKLAIKAKELKVDVAFSQETTILPINAEKFRRVLENILSNAIKFTPRGGNIIISTEKKGAMIALKIQDSGIGIPKELQANLFDRFSKAGRAGLEGEKSVGLGMSIVKQIIELHQGKVEVQSEVNKGTTFYIYLPITETIALDNKLVH